MRARTIAGIALTLFAVVALAPAQPSDPVAIASRLEKNAKRFASQFDKELDKSLYDGRPIEKRLEKRAKKLKSALDAVRGKVKSGKERKIRKKLDRALSIAHDVNAVMAARRFSADLERDWDEIRRDLDDLAVSYGLRPLEVPVAPPDAALLPR